jgi:hypothetical protein
MPAFHRERDSLRSHAFIVCGEIMGGWFTLPTAHLKEITDALPVNRAHNAEKGLKVLITGVMGSKCSL